VKAPLLPYAGQRRTRAATGEAEGPAFEARGLTVAYPGAARPALTDFSLRVERGSRSALVGANGAGKSTLLQAASGILAPEGGELRVLGTRPARARRRVAFLPQRSTLDWRFPMTLERFVLTGRYVHLGWLMRPGRADRAKTAEVMRLLRIDDLGTRLLSELSGGQQQRALLARALVQEAELLLLDEPLNAVDVATREIVEDVLRELSRARRTVIMATHDLGRLDAAFDHAVYLAEGRMVDAPPGAPDPCHGHDHPGGGHHA